MDITTLLLTDDDGTSYYESYAWPSGYPILYLDGHNSALCPTCATKEMQSDYEKDRPHSAFIHYEGPPEYCCLCNAVIESAYGDPDDNAS